MKSKIILLKHDTPDVKRALPNLHRDARAPDQARGLAEGSLEVGVGRYGRQMERKVPKSTIGWAFNIRGMNASAQSVRRGEKAEVNISG